MSTKKRLQDLTIKDNFMFCAVMSEEENCIRFLEMVLGFPISKIDVSYERNLVYHPEYKGIRLDVYAKDQDNKHYNVEMQVKRETAIEKMCIRDSCNTPIGGIIGRICGKIVGAKTVIYLSLIHI